MPWIEYEQYHTMVNSDGSLACKTCMPHVGRIFRKGKGPQPPLHRGCNCFRLFHHYEWQGPKDEIVPPPGETRGGGL
jgi:hypothetical protein